MKRNEFRFETVITAERGNYLKFKDKEISSEKIGKPIRIIFSNKAEIPEFEELPLEDIVNEDIEEKSTKKTTRKKIK